MHNERMAQDAAITIRLPASLRRRLESRATAQRRSLSAQVVFDLEQAAGEAEPRDRAKGRLLGIFAGTKTPTDRDIAEVRQRLWGSLGRRG
jgi:hypothetical protein